MSVAAERKPFTPRPMKGDAGIIPIAARKKTTTKGQRFTTINMFVDLAIRDLTRVEALAWLTLWRHERGGIAELSAGAIGTTIGASRRAVTDALRSLQDQKLIRIVKRGGVEGDANRYRLLCPNPTVDRPTT